MATSKLHRRAQERLRALNEAQKRPTTVASGLAAASEGCERRGGSAGSQGASRALSREELEALRNEAIVRERAKRRKQREIAKQKELADAKREAIARERFRTPTRPLKAQSSMKKNFVVSRDEIASYKEEAKKREQEKARKASKLAAEEKRRSLEIQRLKDEAVERERERLRKLKKGEKLKFMGGTQLLRTRTEVEAEFNSIAHDGLVQFAVAKEMVTQKTYFKLKEGGRTPRFVSWVTLESMLLPIAPLESKFTTASKATKNELALILNLCKSTFDALAKHSMTSMVYPSDLNAVHAAGTDEKSVRFLNGLRLPKYESKDDKPIDWESYRSWILSTLGSEDVTSVLARFEQPGLVLQDTKSSGEDVEEEEDDDDEDVEEEEKNTPEEDAERNSVTSQMAVVEQKLQELQDRLNGQEEERNEEQEDPASSVADIEDSPPVQSPELKIAEEIADEILFKGRCWVLCERRREDWLFQDSPEDEWERSREVCAEVEVTQTKNPFRMYISVHLLRSGARCVRRIGMEELTRLTSYHAAQMERNKLALSRSGHHVILQREGLQEHQCRSLGPEMWTKEDLEAAIRATSAMKDWIKEGRIPKQRDLVQWILLHSTLRVRESGPRWQNNKSNNHLEQENGEDDDSIEHAHLVLPGDSFSFAKLENSATTAISEARWNAVPRKEAYVEEVKAKMREILNELDLSSVEVERWRACATKKDLVEILSNYARPEVQPEDLFLMVKRCKNVNESLKSLIDLNEMRSQWRKQTKGLRVADLFDLFRTHESVGGNAGEVELDAFLRLLQDTLLIKIPMWQLAIWHSAFPFYRDFLRQVFRLCEEEVEEESSD